MLNGRKSYSCDELVNLKFVNKAETGLTCAVYKHSEEAQYIYIYTYIDVCSSCKSPFVFF